MRNKYILTLATALCCLSLNAQQESQYTQFMHNKIMYNPAYAGYGNNTTITLLHRQQWLGFEKAPQSQVFSVHAPFLVQNVGWGLMVSRQTAGIMNRWSVSLPYSYRIGLGEDHNLQLGIQGSLRYVGINFADPTVTASDANDPVIFEGGQGRTLGNAGAGAFWSYGSFYAGLSVPHIFSNELNFSEESRDVVSRQIAHIYLMAGANFPISELLSLMPNLMLKRVKGAPLGFDVNMNFLFYDKFTAGASYRSGGKALAESIDLLFLYKASEILSLGAAYDFSVGPLSSYNNGGFELMLRFDIGSKRHSGANENGGNPPRVF